MHHMFIGYEKILVWKELTSLLVVRFCCSFVCSPIFKTALPPKILFFVSPFFVLFSLMCCLMNSFLPSTGRSLDCLLPKPGLMPQSLSSEESDMRPVHHYSTESADPLLSNYCRLLCFSIKKLISTSEQRAEHLFAGRNTQHLFTKLELQIIISRLWISILKPNQYFKKKKVPPDAT